MIIKKILILLVFLMVFSGCERGVGQEPIEAKNVTEKDLIGTWVLSTEYTNKKLVNYLGDKSSDYYFILKPNHKLEYHSFHFKNEKNIITKRGKWELFSKYLELKEFNIGTIYISSDGWHSANPNSSKLKKPIVTRTVKGFKRIERLRITQKNNKLLLWYYDGDPDARRYIMYEKKI